VQFTVIETTDIENPELDPDAGFTYKATVELKPELPEIEFKGLELKKTVYTVSDEEISKQFEMFQKHMAEYEPIDEDRGAETGDHLSIDYTAFENGAPSDAVQPATDHALTLGKSEFTETFDQEVAGMKAGEEKSITINFPEDFNNPELAGKEIVFVVTVKEMRKEVLPPIDDELAKKMGPFETLGALEMEIRNTLQAEYDNRSNQEHQEQIFDDMIQEEFEVPEVLVNFEIDEIIRDSEKHFAENGLSMEQLGLTREAMTEKYRPIAEKQARRHLLLNKVTEQAGLSISDEEMDAEIEKLAAAMNQPIDMIKSYYKQNPQKIDGFKHAMLEKRAIDLIIDNAVITEAPPETEAPDETATT